VSVHPGTYSFGYDLVRPPTYLLAPSLAT